MTTHRGFSRQPFLNTVLSVALVGALAVPPVYALRQTGLEESSRLKETLVTQLRSASSLIPAASAGMEEVRRLLLQWLALPPAPSFFQSPEAQIIGQVANLSQGAAAHRNESNRIEGDRMRQRLVDVGLATLDAIESVIRVRSATGPEVKDRLTVIRAKRFRDTPPSPKRDIGPHPFDDGTIFGTGTQDPVYYKLIKLVDDVARAHTDDWHLLVRAYQVMVDLYGMRGETPEISDDDATGTGLERVTKLLDEATHLPPMVRSILVRMREALSDQRLGSAQITLTSDEQAVLQRLYTAIYKYSGYDPRRPIPNHRLFSYSGEAPTESSHRLIASDDLYVSVYISSDHGLDGSVFLKYLIYVQVRNGVWDRLLQVRGWTPDMERAWAQYARTLSGPPLVRPGGVSYLRYPTIEVTNLAVGGGTATPFQTRCRLEDAYPARRDPTQLFFADEWSVVALQARLPAILALVTYVAPRAVEAAVESLESGLEEQSALPILLLAPSAFEQLSGLEEVVHALQRTRVGGARVIVLPADATPDAVRNAVEPAVSAGARVTIVAEPRDPIAAVAARALQQASGARHLDIQFVPPVVLQPWVMQIRRNLGALDAGGLEEAAHEFLWAVGLAEAA